MANIKEQAAAVNMLPNARLTAAQVAMERPRHDVFPCRAMRTHRRHGHFHIHAGHIMHGAAVAAMGRHAATGRFIGPDPQRAGPQRNDGPDQQHDAHHGGGALPLFGDNVQTTQHADADVRFSDQVEPVHA